MKIFISSDIEGTAGIAAWVETDERKGGAWYEYFRQQMTREVVAACEGAMDGGATSILVKDAHDTARNIDPAALPREAQINRGWNGGLFSMVAGLSKDFDAVAFTGYHAPAGSAGNPMSHTMNNRDVDEITINGKRAAEFHIHSYIAGMLGVPVVFVSGDAALCKMAREFLPSITAVAVSAGEGDASTSPHPDVAVDMIREGMRKSLATGRFSCQVDMPESFDVKVRYTTHQKAFFAAYYPGAQQLDEKTVGFVSEDYYEVLRFFHFCL
ncbi:M55 family metallopeptidase [Clostridia bacterium OttesenSCG-928-O13]|nr:M55 family metallopeptidase [Clostridia bacterium OttesenSCG-928-O13]